MNIKRRINSLKIFGSIKAVHGGFRYEKSRRALQKREKNADARLNTASELGGRSQTSQHVLDVLYVLRVS